MAINKLELFEEGLRRNAALFKALGHPARLAVLKYLAGIKTCICGDISNELPLSRTTVNQHLKELKKVGLIKGEVEGVKTNYCINPEKVEWLEKTLTSFIEEIKTSSGIIKTEDDCC